MQNQENSHSELKREAQCSKCGSNYTQRGVRLSWGKEMWNWVTLCPACSLSDESSSEAAAEETARERHEHLWVASIPWLYRETDTQRMRPKLVEIAERFNFQQGKGLYLSGSFGIGKTRGLTLILRRCHDEGKTILFMNAIDLGRAFADRFHSEKGRREKSEQIIRRSYKVDVLLIDDLGKERATERFETEMYGLLEERTTNGRPLLVSSNYTIDDLASRFSQDQGGAVMRRLAEFCHVYHL